MSDSITSSSLNEGKIACTAYLDLDKERITIERINDKQKRPNFLMAGSGAMNKHRIQSIDLLKELANSSKAGQYLILSIKDGIKFETNYNPVVKLVSNTSTEKQYLLAGYKELHSRGLVKRIKQSHYMINPNALIPPDYDSAIDIWNSVD